MNLNALYICIIYYHLVPKPETSFDEFDRNPLPPVQQPANQHQDWKYSLKRKPRSSNVSHHGMYLQPLPSCFDHSNDELINSYLRNVGDRIEERVIELTPMCSWIILHPSFELWKQKHIKAHLLEPWLYHDLRICPAFTRSFHLRLLDFQSWSHSLEGMYETNVWVTSTRRLSFSPELSVPYIVHLHIKFRNSSLNIPEGCILLCLIFLTCLKLKLKSYGQNYTSTLSHLNPPKKYCLTKASAWRKKERLSSENNN